MLNVKFIRKFFCINSLPYILTSIFLHLSLVVSSVGLEDDGIYTLTASNSVGETTATAKLGCHSKSMVLISSSQIKKKYDL